MGTEVVTSRAVEVLHDRGPGRTPRWTVGSAYLVGGRYVLTAAHAVDYQQAVGAPEQLLVRSHWPAKGEYSARVVVAGTAEVDLALLEIDGAAFPGSVGPVRWAQINRDDPQPIGDCWAMGFPKFKEQRHTGRSGVRLRNSEQVGGWIYPGSDRVTETLELEVTSRPREEFPAGGFAGSPWQGMSGAVVFTSDGGGDYVAVGVVVEHHRPAGASSLTIAPVTVLAALLTEQRPNNTADAARRILAIDDPTRWLQLPLADTGGTGVEVSYGSAVGRLRDIPSLPPHFMPLPRVAEALHAEILGASAEAPPRAQPRVTALCGMGGVGKSVQAAAFARDTETRAAFPDGVLWLSFGREADPSRLFQNVRLVAAAFAADLSGFGEMNLARARLPELLSHRACLLVLDDVWSKDDAELFRPCLGDRSHLIVTTRDGAIATALGATEHWLEALSDDESLELVARWVSTAPAAERELASAARGLPMTAVEVVARCGKLPLALALAGAAVREGTGWSSLLTALRRSELDYLDHAHGSIMRSLKVSVESLDAAVRPLYLSLCVYRPRVPIPEKSIWRLWSAYGLQAHQAERTITQLARKSLLRAEGPVQERLVRLHDLQYDYAKITVDDWRALHARLLDAYGARFSDGWHPIDDDGYLLSHLFYHQANAGRQVELGVLAGDLRYLAMRAYLHSAHQAEADVTTAMSFAPDDAALWELRRALQMGGHLLDACDSETEAWQTLRSRIGDVSHDGGDGREGAGIPHLVALTPLPDLPHPAMIRVYRGHWNSVNASVFTPDAQQIVSASRDGTVKTWDVAKGTLMSSRDWHSTEVTDCDVSVDGQLITASYGIHDHEGSWDSVEAGEAGALRIWRLDELDEPDSLVLGHTDRIHHCTYSPDGMAIATCSRDKAVRLWDARRGGPLHVLLGHEDDVDDVAFSPDGTLLVSASSDGTLKLWSVESGAEVSTLRGHQARVAGCAFSPDGRRIASVSYDMSVRLWDVASGRQLREYVGHTNIITQCRFSPDGRVLVTSGENHLRFWDVESAEQIGLLHGHTDVVAGFDITADWRYLVSASYDQTIRLWDLTKLGEDIQPARTPVQYCEAFDPDTIILSGYGFTELRPIRSGTPTRTVISTSSACGPFGFNTDRSEIVLAARDGTLHVGRIGTLDPDGHSSTASAAVENLQLQVRLMIAPDTVSPILGCGFSEGDRLVVAATEEKIFVFASSDGTLIRTIEDGELINACAIDATSPVVVTGGGNPLLIFQENPLTVWNVADGKRLATFQAHNAGPVNGCSVSSRHGCVLSVSSNGELAGWHFGTWDALFAVQAHRHGVFDGPFMALLGGATACALSHDGEFITSVSADDPSRSGPVVLATVWWQCGSTERCPRATGCSTIVESSSVARWVCTASNSVALPGQRPTDG